MPDAQHYLSHIAAYEREFASWERRGDKILKNYRDDKERKTVRFNVLWSNVQTLKAATFSRMPQPDVSRRFKDNDPVGRVAALMLERALEFEVHHYKDFGASIRQAVYDRFLPGRGVAWVRYEPTFKQVQAGVPEDGPTLTEDVDTETEVAEELDFECAPVDYVHWKDFGHNVARTWEEVSIVWRRVFLTRAKLKEKGGAFEKLPLDAVPDDQKTKNTAETNEVNKCALLYEIWDKDTGKVLFLSKSKKDIIDEQDDPLGLEEFFPCPPPLFATLTTDTLVPLPDFTLYQDQARELDTLSDRIDGLVQQLQVKGCYDASVPELARLFTEGSNGTLLPVKNWAGFAEKQGLAGAISLVEILPIAQALKEAYMAFDQIKGQIYELTGISDILRGETAPSETATAQKIKNSYASMRLKTYQDEVERFAARLLQLKAQIICKHFDAQTICQISGCEQLSQEDQALVPQAVQMLKDNVTRTFRIEIETDSMVFQDEQQDKQDSMEFLQALGGFLKEALQAPPSLVPLLAELLKFSVRSFRVGKNVEGAIDSAADQMKKVAMEQAQNPQPHPDAIKAQSALQAAQIKAQSEQASGQLEAQTAAAREQAETQRQQAQLQHDQAMEQMRLQSSQTTEQQKLAYQAQCDDMQRQHEAALKQTEDEFNRWKVQMDNETKVLVAELAAKTTLATATLSAATTAATSQNEGDGEDKPKPKKDTGDVSAVVEAVNSNLSKLIDGQQASHKELVQAMTRPKKVLRDGAGTLVGVE